MPCRDICSCCKNGCVLCQYRSNVMEPLTLQQAAVQIVPTSAWSGLCIRLTLQSNNAECGSGITWKHMHQVQQHAL